MSTNGLAERVRGIAPFHVMELLRRAKELEAEGRSVIHMEIGEPDFTTPELVNEAAKQSLDRGETGYTPAAGLPVLRQAIAKSYSDEFQVQVDSSRILVTPGASGALQLFIGGCVDAGKEVILAEPGYPCNPNFVKMFGGVPRLLPVDASTNYQLTAGQIEEAWSDATAAVMVASPSNPTGTLLSRSELEDIYSVVKAKGGVLLVDEIYHRLVYEKDCYTALDLSEDIFVINSFSKYYGMTGWRVGWIVVPPAYVEAFERISQNIFISSSTPGQYAAIKALEMCCDDIFAERKQAFKERRDFLYPALKELGFKFPVMPEGAFYLYADCSSFTDDSYTFCWELLESEGVAVTPGKDFGSNNPQHHIRFAYTTDIAELSEGVSRIKRFLASRNS